jgi:archaeal type IV pilus assembly protein PilA
MNTYRKFKKNAKALSPVVASIILIAVTVAVSVVVAAWMGGMTIGLMGSAEQVSITNVEFDKTNEAMLVTVSNSGSTTVTINNVYVNGVSATLAYASPTPSPAPSPAYSIVKASTLIISTDLPNSVTSGALSPGSAYTVKIITAKGTAVVSAPTTYNP